MAVTTAKTQAQTATWCESVNWIQDFRQGPLVGYCGRRNEPSGFKECPQQLSKYQLLQKDSTA